MSNLPILREDNIASYIYFIRGEKVMLDADIAKLYEVETRVLKQGVRKNLKRFPGDFMFGRISTEKKDRIPAIN